MSNVGIHSHIPKYHAEVMKEVDVKLLEPPVDSRERAKRLLKHAFCKEDGSPLPEMELADYHVTRLNDLYDATMAEVSEAGKSYLEPAQASTSATSSNGE